MKFVSYSLQSEIDVQYIDTMTSEIVPIEKVSVNLPDCIYEQPCQVQKCRLAGVKPVSTNIYYNMSPYPEASAKTCTPCSGIKIHEWKLH